MPRTNPRTKARYDHDDDDDEEQMCDEDAPSSRKKKGTDKKQRRDVERLSSVIATRREEDMREEAVYASYETDLVPSTRDEQMKRRLLRRLVRLKQERKTHRECADILSVSEKTIYNYLQDPMYAEVMQDMTKSAQEDGHVRISEAITDAVDTLYSIMRNGDSEFVRMKSAELLLNYAGFDVPREQKQTESKAEYDRFMRLVDEKMKMQPQVNISIHTGGTPESRDVPQLSEGRVVDADQGDTLPPELQKYAITVLPGGKLPKHVQEQTFDTQE